jgi:hypothetical protein
MDNATKFMGEPWANGTPWSRHMIQLSQERGGGGESLNVAILTHVGVQK